MFIFPTSQSIYTYIQCIIYIILNLLQDNTNLSSYMNMQYQELKKIGTYIGKYRIEYLIAAGTFGKVYLVTFNSKRYAIKQMAEPNRANFKQQMENQIKVLTDMNHQNIVKLYEVIRERGYVYLVMQFCQTDMKEVMANHNGHFQQSQAYNILYQVINGMNELVKLHIVHRDLKPANILCSKGVFKLADFGLAKYIQDQCQLLKTRVGTPFYMAPQILKGQKYTSKCDIWSLGIIFYQLIFGCLPWYAISEQSLLFSIYNSPLSFPKPISEKTHRILSGMIAIEEHQRFSWEELLKQINAYENFNSSQLDKSFSQSTIQKLINVQMNRMSISSYGKKLQFLKNDEKNSIGSLLIRHFNQQNRQICGYFIKNSGN